MTSEREIPKNRVREVAEAKGLTAVRLSQRAELSYPTVKALWDNPRRDVSLATLGKISKVLKVSVKDLIDDEEGANAEEQSQRD